MPLSDGTIEQFVGGVLGCGCPAAVFQSVTLEDNPSAFADLVPARLIRIGGRLLVLLLDVREREAAALPLEQLFARGRQLRDSQGYNRFRLVVAAPASVHRPLAQRFTGLDLPDERLHLHVVSAGQLPPALAAPLQHGVLS